MNNLRQAAIQALDLMEVTLVNLHGYWRGESEKRITALREALADAERGPENQPLAWFRLDEKTNQSFLVWFPSADGKDWKPLYAAPRKPLTPIVHRSMLTSSEEKAYAAGWKAAERAHGIGGRQ